MTSMADVLETQLRLIYSLLKPAIRAAAHFDVPIKTLTELVRLAYFEHLSRAGLSIGEVARTFGQTPRHMRSLAQKLEGDFFEAERKVGLVREVEAVIAAGEPTESELVRDVTSWPPRDVREAVAQLEREGRVERSNGRLRTANRYVVLRTDGFHHRIDAINHFLDAAFRAVLHRLVFDDRHTANLKTISFSALADDLRAFLERLEGDLRRELAELDETATFAGRADERYTLALGLAPMTERPDDFEENLDD